MKTKKWTKVTFTIDTTEINNVKSGYQLGVLGVAMNYPNGCRRAWHIPTGLALPGYFKRLRDAKKYVEAIIGLTNWQTLTRENQTERLTPIRDAVMKAANA